jgi:signal transduction histidine kinase
MDMRVLEKDKQQWKFAADSMPQFVCLLDREGRVIRANRTVERWKLGIDIEDAGGLYLHDALHRDCDNSRCYLRRFGEGAALALAEGRCASCDAWDPILKRQFLIRARRPILTQQRENAQGSPSEVFAVVTIDDVTEFKVNEKESEKLTRVLDQRVLHEQGIRTQAEEALRASQGELLRLGVQHLTIQETERRRIAADLHDGLGQSLTLLKLGIQVALEQMGAGAPRKAVNSVKQLIPKVQDALNELRRVAMDLRPSTLDDLGLLPTLSWFLREFQGANLKIRIEKHISISEKDVPEPLKLAIFRILQEAVNNAVKYSGAECIRVSLHNEDGVLAFTVEDDGKGFDPGALASRGDGRTGLGMQSMRERAELSGGNYAVTSAVGHGTKVCASWPASKAAGGNRDQAGYSSCGVQSGVTVDAVEARPH